MTFEEKSALYDLTEGVGFPVLLDLVEQLVELQEREVLTYNVVTQGLDGLLYRKCEAHGARKLKVALEAALKNLRKQSHA